MISEELKNAGWLPKDKGMNDRYLRIAKLSTTKLSTSILFILNLSLNLTAIGVEVDGVCAL
ncbi:hypothetical protein P278_30800 [Zhouia amylolytica AD3]|uniref:Uncharacterized protein n=1 Tax=Zhouia amylolytica AD3 TaxID=1286632 RepID=W2ULI1_9FLAO|nr:hypothetical protein P278_30800 [Zhouia amylolytica AD3]